jgi:hypothetical protein
MEASMNSPNPHHLPIEDRGQPNDDRRLPANEPPQYAPEDHARFAPDAPPLHDTLHEHSHADNYDPVWTGQGEIGPSEALAQADLDRIEQILSSEHFRIRRKRTQEFVPPPPPRVQRKGHGFRWAVGTFVLLVGASAFIAYQTTDRLPLLDSTADASGALARVAALFGQSPQASTEMKEVRTPPAPSIPAPVAAVKTHLVVTGASADSPEQILLGVSAEGISEGMNAVVGGLVPGTTLTSGRPWGTTGWILPAAELATTHLRPPAGFSGTMEYSVSLQRADNSVIDRQTMRLEWTSPTAQQPAPSQQAEARSISPEEVAGMLKRGEELLVQGDIASARLLLQRAADAQDARAALALAASYDPIEMKRLGVYGATSDVAKARDWYEKAKQYGSREAPKRLELLASQFR